MSSEGSKASSSVASLIADLTPRLEEANTAQQQRARTEGSAFNLVDWFRNGEIGLSELFRELLDPRGQHGQDSLFLALFLKRFGFSESWIGACANAVVRKEALTRLNRRIDLLIEVDGMGVIGIENKPWAIEQDEQLDDYADHLHELAADDAHLLYLSGDGSEPLTLQRHSMMRDDNRFRTIPYAGKRGPTLQAWAADCAQNATAPKMQALLKDLELWLARMGDHSTHTESGPAAEAARFLVDALREESGSATIRAAFAIRDSLPQVINSVYDNLAARVCEKLRDEGFPDAEPAPMSLRPDEKYGAIGWRLPSWPTAIAVKLEFQDRNWRNPVFGIWAPGSGPSLEDYVTSDLRSRLEAECSSLQRLGKVQTSPEWPRWVWMDGFPSGGSASGVLIALNEERWRGRFLEDWLVEQVGALFGFVRERISGYDDASR